MLRIFSSGFSPVRMGSSSAGADTSEEVSAGAAEEVPEADSEEVEDSGELLHAAIDTVIAAASRILSICFFIRYSPL